MTAKAYLSLSTFCFLAISCSLFDRDKNDGNSGAPNKPELPSCDHVVTNEAVASYHKTQTLYRVEPYGWDVTCKSYLEINGKRTEVERQGKSSLKAFPKFKFVGVSKPNSEQKFFLTAEEMKLTEDDVKNIFQGLGLTTPDESEINEVLTYPSMPSYVRFERGHIFYLSNPSHVTKDGKTLTYFKVDADDGMVSELQEKIAELESGQTGLEWLWLPKNGLSKQVTDSSGHSTVEWADTQTVKLIASMAREGKNPASQMGTKQALGFAIWWDLDVQAVHQEVPEIFDFANRRWENPVIADNTVGELLSCLRYIAKVKPEDQRSNILSTYEKLNNYVTRSTEALQIAVDYVLKSRWDTPRFNQLMTSAETLSSAFRGDAWGVALEINQRVDFDVNRAILMAKVGVLMRKNGLLEAQNPKANVDGIEAKIAAGLTSEKIDLYFAVLDLIVQDFSVNGKTASIATDRWVLGGKITETNKASCLGFLRWLHNDVYANFSAATDVFDNLALQADVSKPKFALFKSAYQWLSTSLYLSRDNALNKSSDYFKSPKFDQETFQTLKNYYEWLVSSIYLNRNDALVKAENVVITSALGPEQIGSIRRLTDWFINTIYLNRNEALQHSEDLVLVKKISTEQVGLLQDVVHWLVNSLYLSKPESVNRAEGYLFAAAPLTSDRFLQLKGIVNWYIGSIYLNKPDALTKGESLVVSKNLSNAQTDLIMASATWLIGTVYIDRSEAASKSETYVIEHSMDADKFKRLKSEFDSALGRGVNRTQALADAEKSVLGI